MSSDVNTILFLEFLSNLDSSVLPSNSISTSMWLLLQFFFLSFFLSFFLLEVKAVWRSEIEFSFFFLVRQQQRAYLSRFCCLATISKFVSLVLLSDPKINLPTSIQLFHKENKVLISWRVKLMTVTKWKCYQWLHKAVSTVFIFDLINSISKLTVR